MIVSDVCGCAPDLAEDATAGRVSRCGDVASLAQAMQSLLEAPPSSEAIAAKARRHSIGAAVDGIVAAVHSTAKSNRAQATG